MFPPVGPAPPGPEPDGGPHPRYTHDGRWFWTGQAWVPAAEVLGEGGGHQDPRRDPVVSAPARPAAALMRWRIVTAAALMVVLIGSGLGHWALGRVGRDSSPAPGIPSAESVLRSPYTHHVGSATFRAVGMVDATRSASGEIFFTPQRGFAITERVNGSFNDQLLAVGGFGYERDEPDGPWLVQPTYPGEYARLGWDGGVAGWSLTVGGPVKIGGEEAWHLWDWLGEEWWVGVHSGRPLQAEALGYRYTFSNFGKAPRLRRPSPSQVASPIYHGQIGRPLVTPAFTIKVDDPRVSATHVGLAAPSGYQDLSLQVTVTNSLAKPVGLPLGQPVVTSAGGGEYWQNALQESTKVANGTPELGPGASESGTLVFDVAKGVHQVRLLVSTAQLVPDLVMNDYLAVVTVPL